MSRTVLIPHDEKIHRGGEDSAHTCSSLITVADGVGGWINSGVNPGFYSRSLTKHILEKHISDPKKSTRQLIIESNDEAAMRFEGSATIVALKLKNEKTLQTTWIGDSGYALYRIGESQDGNPLTVSLIYKSKEG